MCCRDTYFVSLSQAETEDFGATLASKAREGTIFALVGPLGAGKTALVRGAVRGLGGNPEQVRSPTFTILNIYSAKMPVYHFDFYRLSPADLESTGFEEFSRADGVVFVEWADRIVEAQAQADFVVTIEYGRSETERIIKISPGRMPSK